MNEEATRLYYEAIKADEAFQDALVAEYGNKATEMRYSYNKSAKTAEMGAAMNKAFETYLAAIR